MLSIMILENRKLFLFNFETVSFQYEYGLHFFCIHQHNYIIFHYFIHIQYDCVFQL